MATTTDVTQRIEIGLWEINAEADFLPELAEGWVEEAEHHHVVWYLEWGELLSRLARLREWYHEGAMTPEQGERYRALVRKLDGHRALMKRLGLPEPPLPEADSPATSQRALAAG